MKINHIGIWVNQLEDMKQFYIDFFGATSSSIYHNPSKQFSSYFLNFQGNCRIELMKSTSIAFEICKDKEQFGYAHLAFSVGSAEKVNELSHKLKVAGFKIISEPRTTGDGYYESCALDSEGNKLEITI